MEEKLIDLYRDKITLFSFELEVKGLEENKGQIRLCLFDVFGKNLNVFFNNEISNFGKCSIQIPKLSNFPETSGNAVLELIVDCQIYVLYEFNYKISNSINIQISNTEEKILEKNKLEIKFNLNEEKLDEKKLDENLLNDLVDQIIESAKDNKNTVYNHQIRSIIKLYKLDESLYLKPIKSKLIDKSSITIKE
jgi:hypothetical protein